VVLRPEAVRGRLLKLEEVTTRLEQLATFDARALRDDFRLKGLGGFRNILVQGYLALDPERVAHALAKAPGDFSEFARAVHQWLATVAPRTS
jgi:uncharacterized protein YutE (UPF0331/DUF86 family)